MDELLNKVAELRGMPASLVKRSAEARAQETGTTLEEVLRDWAGDAGDASGGAAPDSQATAPEVSVPQDSPTAEVVADVSAEATAPQEVTVDYLIQLAADAKRMPPKLILSSAQARATHSGTSVESVLADWAGVDLDDLKAQAAAARSDAVGSDTAEPSTPAPEPAPSSDEDKTSQPGAAELASTAAVIGMDELLEKVAEAKGMPAALAKRSAEARAKKTGEPLESVLAEWAGIDPATVSTGPAEAVPVPPATSEPAPVATGSDADRESASDPSDEIEIIEGSGGESDAAAAGKAPEGGLGGRYPSWLAAAFVIIPLLAVMFILASPNGPDCGTSAQLHIDPVTGNAVNCDGTAYGTDAVDHFGDGAAIYARCQACHGSDGSGSGAGPGFAGGDILATFPQGSCSEQIDWIALGTSGWPDATYGANNKPVGGFGLMPNFGASLSPQQIAAVSLYERVQFGGQDLAAAVDDCGLNLLAEASG